MLGGVHLASFVIAMGGKCFSDWWLSYWINQGNGTSDDGALSENPDTDMYMGVYIGSGLGFLLLQALRGYVYNRQMLVASSTLHNSLVARLMQAPMSFFDVTPTGHILTRVSKDLDEVRMIYILFLERDALLLEKGCSF